MDLFKVDLTQAQIKQLIQGGKVGENEITDLGNGLFEITELDCDSYTVNSEGVVQGEITNHCVAEPENGTAAANATTDSTTTQKNSTYEPMQKVSTAEIQEYLEQDKGVTFLWYGNEGCGICKIHKPYMDAAFQTSPRPSR